MRYVTLMIWVGLWVADASAHHSNIAFDTKKVIEVRGNLVRYEWRNPHVYLTIEKDDAQWLVETDATAVMMRSGWRRDSFKAGEVVSARVYPDKDPTYLHGLLLAITGSNGIPMQSQNQTGRFEYANTDLRATSLEGRWGGVRERRVAFWAAFDKHPLTQKGAAGKAAFEEHMNPTARCIPWPTPWVATAAEWYLQTVEFGEATVTMTSEFYDTKRTIYMDGRAHPENGERTNQGHSIGWWEGDTLIVDTTLFTDHLTPIFGVPSGARKHVVERYSLNDDGSRALIDIVLEDPEYLNGPFHGQYTWVYAPHVLTEIIECDPNVAARFIER